MSELPVDLPEDPEEIDVETTREWCASVLIDLIDNHLYKVAGDGRIRDHDRFEAQLQGGHEIGYLVKILLDALDSLEEQQYQEAVEALERLEEAESELGLNNA